MGFKEIILMFGVFLIVFYSASSFILIFNYDVDVPSQIETAWSNSTQQIKNAESMVNENIDAIKAGGINALAGVFGLAFSGLFFVIISLWSTFVSIPTSIFGAINYLANIFSVPTEITTIIITMITVIIILKTIEFITGRTI